jgi:hypothetical protein
MCPVSAIVSHINLKEDRLDIRFALYALFEENLNFV